MVIVVAAMGIRSGLIVGFGIPASFLFSLIFIYLLGYSFNFMVMFGMLLGLGMLIDGAIVVTEYADRKMIEGYNGRDAYLAAAKCVLAGNSLYRDHFGRFLTADVLARCIWQIHALSARHRIYRTQWVATLRTRIRTSYRRHYRARWQKIKSAEETGYFGTGRSSRLRSVTGLYARVLGFATRYGRSPWRSL